MPRYKPPKGYLTSTEVKERLNISGAMVLNYVKQGKIKHVVPPGRKHGYYLEKDVDKLARELQAFFDLEEETEKTEFTVATAEDIPACIALNRELFDIANTEDDEILTRKWVTWLTKNPEIVYVLKRDGEIIGIATVLPFKPHSPSFEEALRGDISFLLGDVKILLDDIEEYKPGNHVQLYIAEIGTKPSLNSTFRRRCGAKLISRFMDTVVDMGRRGVIIEKITAVGATKSGIKLLQHFGFSEVMFPRPDTRLFVINTQESGAPIMRAYREALDESVKK